MSGCTTKSKGNSNSPNSNGIISSSSDAKSNTDKNEIKIYSNNELEFSLEVESECLVHEEKSNDNFDEGKRRSFIIRCNEINIGSIDFTSEDYTEGVGEGCCFYYSSKPIDLSKSNNVLMNELRSFYPKELKRIGLDNKEAIRFFSKKEYANEWIKEMIILPYSKNGYTNMVINGPILKEMKQGSDYDVTDLNLGSKENILFENIIKLLKFY